MNTEEDNSPEAKALVRARKGLMNIEAQVIFDELVQRNPGSLTEAEKAFLFSRRTYLNDRQLSDYEEIFAEQQALADARLAEEGEKPTPKQVETAPVPTRAELEAKATELGINPEDIKRARKNADLEALIAEVEA